MRHQQAYQLSKDQISIILHTRKRYWAYTWILCETIKTVAHICIAWTSLSCRIYCISHSILFGMHKIKCKEWQNVFIVNAFSNYKTWKLSCVDKAYASLKILLFSTYYETSYWEMLNFYNWWLVCNCYTDIFFKRPSQHSPLISS